MGLDTIVDTHPERIIHLEPAKAVSKIDEILLKMDRFEEKMNCEAVVVVVQNKHLGGSYTIVSKEEAISGINGPRRAEWYIEPIYQRSYFEDLRNRLNGDRRKDYS